jgi:hypothetical protein
MTPIQFQKQIRLHEARTRPARAARYGMNAAFMSLELHERGIHAV